MAPDLRKATPTRLRALGLNEKWLHNRIEDNL
jgi:hypothetical protein